MKTTVILLHASIGDGWREISNGVVEGLHLDQKTVLIEWNASYVGSELGQNLAIRGVGKLGNWFKRKLKHYVFLYKNVFYL